MIRKTLKYGGLALALFTAFVYVNNASWLAPEPTGPVMIVAHRGVHHNYDRTNLGIMDCTAIRIFPPTHELIENTLPSMRAAFDHGADSVEIDVHPTTDGEFAVFHDWTIDCRTEGKGVTRKHSLAYLQTLDVGYGYTADGGKTFPLRGKGIGMIPSLREVLTTFPDKHFIINAKGGRAEEAELLLAYLKRHDLYEPERYWIVGAAGTVSRLDELAPELLVISTRQGERSAKACIINYFKFGWIDWIPKRCHDFGIGFPIEWQHFVWGWPNRFLERMNEVNTRVMIGYIDTPAQADAIPLSYRGAIMTDYIEIIGPHIRKRFGPDSAGIHR